MNARTKLSTRTWLFIGGFILIAGVFSVVGLVSQVNKEVDGLLDQQDQPTLVAIHFYEALRNQRYAQAYADLTGQAVLNGQSIDEQTFISLVTQADSQHGTVLAYNLLAAEGDAAGFNATLKRGSGSYTQHIHLERNGEVWKIGSIDGL